MKDNKPVGTPKVQPSPQPVAQHPGVQSPQQDLSKIYVSDTPFSKEIEGVLFKWKEMPGEDVVELTVPKEGKKFNQKEFIRTLIETVVVEPKGLDVSKLKPLVYTLLSAEIQASFGLTEVVQKNLEKKFGVNQASMQ